MLLLAWRMNSGPGGESRTPHASVSCSIAMWPSGGWTHTALDLGVTRVVLNPLGLSVPICNPVIMLAFLPGGGKDGSEGGCVFTDVEHVR